MSEDLKYKIGENTYLQRELTLDQFERMTELLEDLDLSGKQISTRLILQELREKKLIPKALSILLVPEDDEDRPLNEDEIAALKRAKMSDVTRIVSGFFDCNADWLGSSLRSLIQKMSGIVDQAGKIAKRESGSEGSPSATS